MDNYIIFIPYGSRLGFHENDVASTMANIDYKFPQCVCYEEKNEQPISEVIDEKCKDLHYRCNKQ